LTVIPASRPEKAFDLLLYRAIHADQRRPQPFKSCARDLARGVTSKLHLNFNFQTEKTVRRLDRLNLPANGRL
jgi:hypothetical protein